MLGATQVSAGRGFVLGEGGDWVLPEGALGGGRLTLLRVEDGQTVLSVGTRDACVLREGTRRHVELGAFSVDVHAVGAEASAWARSRPSLGPPAHHLASAVLHVALLGALGSYAHTLPDGDLDAMDARERAALLSSMLARSESLGPEWPAPHDDGDSATTGSRNDVRTAGGTGSPAQTEEGSLGHQVTHAKRGHVGVQGPPDAKDPRLARDAELPLPDMWTHFMWQRVPMPDGGKPCRARARDAYRGGRRDERGRAPPAGGHPARGALQHGALP